MTGSSTTGTFYSLVGYSFNLNLKDALMEIVYFIGALILLSALIYGTLNYHYRDRTKSKVADQIVRDRYEHNRT
jgi:uncharacterized membrane protein